jgi:hypothetical protein
MPASGTDASRIFPGSLLPRSTAATFAIEHDHLVERLAGRINASTVAVSISEMLSCPARQNGCHDFCATLITQSMAACAGPLCI